MELGCDLLLADDVRLEAAVDNIPLGEALEGARLHRRGGVGVGAGARPAGVRHGELGLVEGADAWSPADLEIPNSSAAAAPSPPSSCSSGWPSPGRRCCYVVDGRRCGPSSRSCGLPSLQTGTWCRRRRGTWVGGGKARCPADVLGHEGFLTEEVRTPQRAPRTITSRHRVWAATMPRKALLSGAPSRPGRRQWPRGVSRARGPAR